MNKLLIKSSTLKLFRIIRQKRFKFCDSPKINQFYTNKEDSIPINDIKYFSFRLKIAYLSAVIFLIFNYIYFKSKRYNPVSNEFRYYFLNNRLNLWFEFKSDEIVNILASRIIDNQSYKKEKEIQMLIKKLKEIFFSNHNVKLILSYLLSIDKITNKEYEEFLNSYQHSSTSNNEDKLNILKENLYRYLITNIVILDSDYIGSILTNSGVMYVNNAVFEIFTVEEISFLLVLEIINKLRGNLFKRNFEIITKERITDFNIKKSSKDIEFTNQNSNSSIIQNAFLQSKKYDKDLNVSLNIKKLKYSTDANILNKHLTNYFLFYFENSLKYTELEYYNIINQAVIFCIEKIRPNEIISAVTKMENFLLTNNNQIVSITFKIKNKKYSDVCEEIIRSL